MLSSAVFAVLAALLHVLFFAYESVLFERPEVHARFLTRTEDVAAVKPWAYNQGFYNLFLAVGALVGVVLALAGQETSGSRSSCSACGSMLAAAVVLVSTIGGWRVPRRRRARSRCSRSVCAAVALARLASRPQRRRTESRYVC